MEASGPIIPSPRPQVESRDKKRLETTFCESDILNSSLLAFLYNSTLIVESVGRYQRLFLELLISRSSHLSFHLIPIP